MNRTYLAGVKYGRGRETLWDCLQVRAETPTEAREKFREYLFAVNGQFRIYEKTKDGPVLVEENDE